MTNMSLVFLTILRKVSCSSYIGNVRIPLLCITALDDPVCSRETIPWDECRANKHVVLATTQHGGHLGHLEGMTGKSLWWVRAVDEFLCAFNSSSLIRREKIQNNRVDSPLKSIDEAPYVNIREDGLVTAFSNAPSDELGNEQLVKDDIRVSNSAVQQEPNATTQFDHVRGPNITAMMAPVKNCLKQLSKRSKISMWVLACVAITTTWPILGSLFFKKKRRNNFSSSSAKR